MASSGAQYFLIHTNAVVNLIVTFRRQCINDGSSCCNSKVAGRSELFGPVLCVKLHNYYLDRGYPFPRQRFSEDYHIGDVGLL